MDTNELLLSLKQEVSELKNHMLLTALNNQVTDKWIPRRNLMHFFDYGATQMASLEKEEGLVMSKIGKRKFYHRDSIEKLLETNIISKESN